MNVTPTSIIDFLRSRATDSPLDPIELQEFISDLKTKINQLSVTVPDTAADSITVLYSGYLTDGTHSGTVAADLVENSLPSKILTISRTEVGAILDFENREFHNALRNALGNDPEDYKKIIDGKDLAGNRISTDSLWDDASRRFVANSTGVVRVISTDGSPTSIFAQTELPELFNNPNITEIDGIPRDQYLELLNTKGLDAVRDVIYTNSGVQVELSDLSNGNLQKYINLDPGDNFDNYFKLYEDQATRTRLLGYFDGLDPERLTNLKTVTSSAFEVGEELVTGGLAKSANKLGMLGTLAGFMLASYSSSVAAESGDDERAKEIMTEWAADAAGSAAGEAIGITIGGAAVAIIAAAGATISAPLTGAIVLGAALIGGIFGAEGAVGIYELTKDLDKNGKIDLFDAITKTLYGESYTITAAPLPGFEGNRIKLDTSFSRGEIVGHAKTSIAWRYALLHLNPFVIDGDEALYAKHNQNGELNLENFSDQYLTDRAEMLLWRTRYDSAANSYTEEWDTWEITGDWDFIDYTILINGEQPLKLAIDGWNGFPPSDTTNRRVIFGSAGSESLSGDDSSDHLYGGRGDDTLDGKGADDYLEGGSGYDSYLYDTGGGFDTIHDTDGLGTVIYDGETLDGGNKIGDGLYASADGQTKYRFSDCGNGIGSLLINDNILIEKFDSNAPAFLGITLERDRIDDTVNADNTVNGTAGDDPISLLDGGNGSDHIKGLDGNDWARGFPGIDLIEGGPGNDILEGGQDDDVIHGGNAADVDHIVESEEQYPGGSHDWLSGNEGNDQLYGSNGADVLVGGTGNDIVIGGAGNDFIQGDSERKPVDHSWVDAWIYSNDLQSSGVLNPVGSGNDILLGGAGADQIWGQAGDDVINGGIGNDLLSGDMVGLSELGERLLSGEHHGNDAINGDGGNDILEGGGGDDLLFGGDGSDQLYGDSESYVMPDGTLLLRAEYHGQDRLFGGGGDDLLVGGGDSDNLEGGDGADSLFGDDETSGLDPESQGGDTLRGGSGNDQLLGNGGDDQLYGDSGDDSAWGGAGNDYIAGGEGSDYLVGDDDANSIDTDGNDTLLGGAGNDTLYGSGGDDYLGGGAGIDALRGGIGSDTLEGGSGNDYLNGETGADSYIFHSGDGIDVIEGDADDTLILPSSTEIRTSLATGIDGAEYLTIQYGLDDWAFVEGGLETPIDRYDSGDGRILSKGDLLNETLTTAIVYRMQAGGEVSGGRFDDTLVGSPENDTIYGQHGDDILAGGSGDDHLLGGAGVDIYRVGWGTGRDLIRETADGTNLLELFKGVRIGDLNYERQGDDLFIRLGSARDGVLLSDYYNLNQTWRIADQDGEILLNREHEPETTPVSVPDTAVIAWQAFRESIESAYGGLLQLQGFDIQQDGSFNRSYIGGSVNSRWKNNYSVKLTTNIVNEISSYNRLLPDIDSDVIDIRQQVEIQEQFHLSGSNSAYVSAGRSGTNYISADGMFNGISIQGDEILVADYGLNSWRNPLTGELEREIKGYYLYSTGTTVPGNMSAYRLYTETDYQVSVNIAEIEAGSGDDAISTGATRFNLVDGGGGNDLIDASQTEDYIAVPGGDKVTGMPMPGSLLFGNGGDDALYGGALDDVLIGGPGGDFMSGGNGNDTYYLFGTDGGDRIVEWGREGAGGQGDDLLVLPAGVGLSDLRYEWGESVEIDDFFDPLKYGWQVKVPVKSMHTTLKLSWDDSEGVTIVLPHSDKGAGFGIDSVLASNGESRSFAAVMEQAGPGPGQDPHFQGNAFEAEGILSGGAGDDRLTANSDDEGAIVSVLIGGAGSDYLQGNDADNILIGGEPIAEGADGFLYNLRFFGTFWGDAGNRFSGGKGNDEIWTTEGSDTILFGVGDGIDTVYGTFSDLEEADTPQPLSGYDTLSFGAGIAAADIAVYREQTTSSTDNLVFSHANGEDRIYFWDWFNASIKQLNRIEFESGEVWEREHFLALATGETNDTPPVLQMPLDDRDAFEAVPFSIVIPKSTFIHSDGAITYSVELEDGSPLPDWIRFDPDRLLLFGIPDSGKVGSWSIRVNASAGDAPPASDLFTITINSVEGKIVTGDASDERIRGSDKGDVIVGGGGTNTLKGRGGDDWFPIVGSDQGVNIFNGGDGVDRIQGSGDDDLIQVAIFKGDNRVEIIDGGEGVDTLSGDDNANMIDLRDTQLFGIEHIDGLAGNDTILGSSGNDHIRGNTGDDLLQGGDADDKLIGGAGDDWLRGGAGDDVLKGGSGMDTLYGGAGDDLLMGNGGDDEISGGGGNDSIHGSAGDDLIHGGSGRDKLYGGSGNDEINGGKGKDTVYGGAGNDTMDGGEGSDWLYAGDGNDVVLFGRDYGHDSVVMGIGVEDELDRFVDRVIFRAGISADQLWFEAQNTDLDITIIGTKDKLTIVDWYLNSAGQADAFITDEGSVLTRNSVDQLVSVMAGFNPPAMGETQLPEEMRVELEQVIAVGWQ